MPDRRGVGVEGNGLIHFPGTYSSISWTNPVFEDYYAFTVGALEGVPEDDTTGPESGTRLETILSAPEPRTTPDRLSFSARHSAR